MIVADDQLSLAIGKNGQNVRLASKLTGWSIDIRSKKDIAKEQLDGLTGEEAQKSAEGDASATDDSIESLEGVGPKTAEALKAAGFQTIQDLRNAPIEDLKSVKGIGAKTLEKILSALGRGDAKPTDSGTEKETE